ncbi:MAG TPA: histidine kinase [Bryobacteraceae bacterium]|nr:histidine kinase [Bryobacteraceae bacterium]
MKASTGAMLAIDYRDPLLINTVGNSVGMLVFGAMAVLLIKDWRHNGLRQTRLSLTAALLAFFWNLGSLLVLAASGQESLALEALVTFSFSILSLLPAVLLHIVLKRRQLIWIAGGYGLSGVAVLFHVGEVAFAPARLHQFGLLVIAVGYGLLIGTLLVVNFRSKGRKFLYDPELISLTCLLLFSISCLHFGYGHATSAWTAEIAWHHAGIPLTLVVLLQDYRFLLLDVFSRFLLNFGLAAVYSIGAFFIYRHLDIRGILSKDRFWLGIGFVAVCLFLISFAVARTWLQRWVTGRLFRHRGFADCISDLTTVGMRAASEEQLLEECAAAIAKCVGAAQFAVRSGVMSNLDRPIVSSNPLTGKISEDLDWVEAIVPLRFSRGDACQVLLGARRGGRRYLSEDLDALRQIAGAAMEQIERFRSDALQLLVSQAELRALQSQINPHFLFNALNTLYGTIDRQSKEARQFVLNLAEIFRYFLRADRTFIALEEELRIARAYLEIEKLRLGDRLETRVSVPKTAQAVLIPVLSVQPLLENAVKHGVAAQQGKGLVSLTVEETEAGLWIKVQDSGPGFQAKPAGGADGAGVGLDNVRQRLRLCYGDAAALNVKTDSTGTVVSFLIPPQNVIDDHTPKHPPVAEFSSFVTGWRPVTPIHESQRENQERLGTPLFRATHTYRRG